jgi:hypothetical protein
MSEWKNGLLAGLAATIVLSVLMVMTSSVGWMPDAIEMLRRLGSVHFGLPDSAVAAWIAHLAIGVVLWGLVFAGSYETWPGAAATKGAVFAIMIWLLTMSMFMPMVGAGFFGTSIGFGASLAPLVLYLVFGVVLGTVFGRLRTKASAYSSSSSTG